MFGITTHSERTELRTLFPHSADRGLEDLFYDAVHDLRRGDRCWRVSTHTTRVGSSVALPDAFMILRGRQRGDCVAIGEREDGHFRPGQELLDNDLAA